MSSPATEPLTAAAREALQAFAIEPGELTLIHQSENITFKATDGASGAAYVLRLHRPGYHGLESLRSEHVWTRALGAAGVAVPSALTARDGREYVEVGISGSTERRYAGLTRWIEGQRLADLLAQQQDGAFVERCFERIGSILAAVHNQAAGWQPPAAFTRHALDADGLMGEAPFWGRFWEHPILSVAERKLLRATRERLHAALCRYGKSPATYSMIHADPFPDNVLVAEDYIALIDFDDAAFGWHQYDLAVALIDTKFMPRGAAADEACIRGYRAVRKLEDASLAMLPLFELARRLAEIGWLLQRPDIALPENFEATKDFVCARSADFKPGG